MQYTPISAPRGSKKSCISWHTEAALRMLQNNLDEAVGENPRELIVYGGTGKAARNWECYHTIVECLKKLQRSYFKPTPKVNMSPSVPPASHSPDASASGQMRPSNFHRFRDAAS